MDLSPLPSVSKDQNYFARLCQEIIGQQLAGAAAEAINKRFRALFPELKITPHTVMQFSEQQYRDVGMSWAKARYILDLAKKTRDKEVKLDNLSQLDNHLVIQELTKVKGIGQWTAEMFLIFTLGREDVFSHGDLGLNKAIKLLYNFKDKPTIQEIEIIVKRWIPFRSYGSLALWHSLDNR